MRRIGSAGANKTPRKYEYLLYTGGGICLARKAWKMRKAEEMKRLKSWSLGLLFVAAALSGCGSSDNTLHIVSGNQTYETDGENVYCVADYPLGYALHPIRCKISFRTGSAGFLDSFEVFITDASAIYYEHLGELLTLGGGLVQVDSITFQGFPQPVFDGRFRFTQITDVPGGRITADYQLMTANMTVEGHFSGKVQ
jgi:hypothetical protein